MSNEMKKDASLDEDRIDPASNEAEDDLDAAVPDASEVATRISLLGKLIIPPSVSR